MSLALGRVIKEEVIRSLVKHFFYSCSATTRFSRTTRPTSRMTELERCILLLNYNRIEYHSSSFTKLGELNLRDTVLSIVTTTLQSQQFDKC